MRIVIKIGTSTLTHASGQLNIRRMEQLCKAMADLKNAGHEIIVVSSGAIALGVGELRLPGRPKDIPSRQAAAAVGQCQLIFTYDKLFAEYHHTAAQVLLTADDIADAQRHKNVESTLFRLLELGVIPVINENDTVATAELEGGVIGDNDMLSAEVAVSAGAELLILLTDIAGLHTADPNKDASAKRIPLVHRVDGEMIERLGGSHSGFGTGGMRTKLKAAQFMQLHGIDMVIASGQNPECLYEIVAGADVGTKFAFSGCGEEESQ